MLSAPLESPRVETKKRFEPAVLGIEVDSLLARLDQSLAAGAGFDFEKTVADAIRNSDTDLVVESPERDRGADLAIWSDVLEALVGNPLLVEVRLRIKTQTRAAEAFKQVGSYLGLSAIRWALLLYGEGPPADDPIWRSCPPNILLMPARALVEALRTKTFPEIVRDLRNRRVHGVRP